MPVLYLLRHANAGYGAPGQSDHERALNDVGERASLVVGQYLRQLSVQLDLVLCSSALRTRQTWELLSERLDNPPQARFEESLYLCGGQVMRQQIRALPKDAESVMLIAHNPDIQETALRYSRLGNADTIEHLRHDYPPAGLAALEFECSWPELSGHAGRLTFYVRPRDLV